MNESKKHREAEKELQEVLINIAESFCKSNGIILNHASFNWIDLSCKNVDSMKIDSCEIKAEHKINLSNDF